MIQIETLIRSSADQGLNCASTSQASNRATEVSIAVFYRWLAENPPGSRVRAIDPQCINLYLKKALLQIHSQLSILYPQFLTLLEYW